jgi:hypothetical protein
MLVSQMLFSEGSARSRLKVFFERERPLVVGECDVVLDAPRSILSRVRDLTRIVLRQPGIQVIRDAGIEILRVLLAL